MQTYIIATPFMEMSNLKHDLHARCPTNFTDPQQSAIIYNQTGNSSIAQNGSFNPVAWTYIIFGCYVLLSGLTLLILAALHIEDHIEVRHQTIIEKREEEPIKELFCLFIPILLYYFCMSGVVYVFNSYLYSVALCSSLGFSVSDALTLNIIYYVGFTLSRFLAIGYTKFFQPATMIGYCLTGATIGSVCLSIFGRTIPLLMWIVSPLYAVFTAVLYPTGMSWTSRITNVSKTYILLFGFGNIIGHMTILPLAGHLFELDPLYVIYLVCALTIGTDIIFLWMSWAGKQHVQSKEKIPEDSSPDEETGTSRLL